MVVRGRVLCPVLSETNDVFKGPSQVKEHLSVYTPIVLPFPHSAVAVAVNTQILTTTISLLRRRMGMPDFQLWTFLPTAVDYAGHLGESLLIYHCTDEWSQFKSVHGQRLADMERELCAKADLVFTTSRTLLEKKKAYNPETHLASHGVDHAHFAAALDQKTTAPPEVASLPRPVIGFFGLVENWIDIDLFAYLADKPGYWRAGVNRL